MTKSKIASLWAIRLRRLTPANTIWDVRAFPVIDGAYDSLHPYRTHVWLHSALPYDEFWFDLPVDNDDVEPSEMVPPEVLNMAREFLSITLVQVRSGYGPSFLPPYEDPVQRDRI